MSAGALATGRVVDDDEDLGGITSSCAGSGRKVGAMGKEGVLLRILLLSRPERMAMGVQ